MPSGGAPPKRFLLSFFWNRLRSLYAGVAKHNAASIRVLQKCGFTFLESHYRGADDADDTHVFLVFAAPTTR